MTTKLFTCSDSLELVMPFFGPDWEELKFGLLPLRSLSKVCLEAANSFIDGCKCLQLSTISIQHYHSRVEFDENGFVLRSFLDRARKKKQAFTNELIKLLRLPWWSLPLRRVRISSGLDKFAMLNDDFVSVLMQRFQSSPVDDVHLSIDSDVLERPVFHSRNLKHLCCCSSRIVQFTITPNLQTISIKNATRLKFLINTCSGNLRVLKLKQSSCLAIQDLLQVLNSHSQSLEVVKMALPNECAYNYELASFYEGDGEPPHDYLEPSGLRLRQVNSNQPKVVALTPLVILEKFNTLHVVELSFTGKIALEVLIPILVKVRKFCLSYTGEALEEMMTRKGYPQPLTEWSQQQLKKYAPLPLETVRLFNVGSFRHEWEHILHSCSHLKFYSAHGGYQLQTYLDSVGIDFASHEDVFALPSSITHVYKSRCGFFATAGPWDLRTKYSAVLQAHREVRIAQMEYGADMDQNLYGVTWSERSESMAPRCCGPRRPPLQLSVGELEDEFYEKFGALWECKLMAMCEEFDSEDEQDFSLTREKYDSDASQQAKYGMIAAAAKECDVDMSSSEPNPNSAISEARKDVHDEEQEAIRRSIEEYETDQMTQGIVASLLEKKIEDNEKDVMVSRLTKNSNSDQVQQAIFNAEHLQDTVACVMRLGYGTRAPNGATILVPLSCEEIDRMALRPFDLVHHRKDLDLIKEALKHIPKMQRPKIKEEHYANNACSSARTEVTVGTSGQPDEPSTTSDLVGYEVCIEKTFVKVRSIKGDSDGVHSAP